MNVTRKCLILCNNKKRTYYNLTNVLQRKMERKILDLKRKLKKKFSQMKTSDQARDETLEEFFKPVVTPLKDIKSIKPTRKRKIKVKSETESESEDYEDDSDEEDEKESNISWSPGQKTAKVLPHSQQPDFSTPKLEVASVPDTTPVLVSSSPLEFSGRSSSAGADFRPSPHTTAAAAQSAARRVFTPPAPPSSTSRRSIDSLLPNQNVGDTALHFLNRFFHDPDRTDPTFGLRYNLATKNLEMGDKVVKVVGNDLSVDNRLYAGRRQLWGLLTLKDLKESSHPPAVLGDYASMIKATNSIYTNNDPTSTKPKSSKGVKYMTIIKPIWEEMKRSKKGYGMLKKTLTDVEIKYYDDPNELVDRLRLLYHSTEAGGDAHRNEIVEILTELEERKIINKKETNVIYTNIFGK